MTYPQDAAPIFINIKRIVEKSQNLVGYPFEKVFDLFHEMDDVFDEVIEYEDLIDCLIENSTKRDGEIQGAIKYLKRGFKRLESGKPYQAITFIGKALSGLYKEETSDAIIIGLRAMSSAYEAVGLLWAARASALFASSLLIDDFWKHDHLNEQQIKSFMRLCWLELKLGRLGQALQWYELVQVVQSRIGKQVISDNECMNLDGYISHLLLNTKLNDLKQLECIPNALNRLGLYNSSGFLQYSLGYDQELIEIFEEKSHQELLDYILLVRDYDFGIKTSTIVGLLEKRGKLSAYVLGCSISINFPLRTPFLELSESILSVIESFFATGHVNKLHAKEAKLHIEVIADDDDGISITHELDDKGSALHVEITCSDFEVETINQKAQRVLHDWIGNFLIEIFCRIFYVPDPKSVAEQLIAEDKGLERAISFSSSFAATYNIVGKDSLNDAKKFFYEDSPTTFTLNRVQNWDVDHPKISRVKETNTLSSSANETQQEPIDLETLKHSDIAVQSLIKSRLWDKTTWKGVGFSLYPDGSPGIDLIFADETAGSEIFGDLFAEVGINNKESRLQVNILKGISVIEPHNYRVQICENFDTNSPSQLMTVVSRLNTMTPASNENLNRFIEEFNKFGSCRLGFGAIRNGQMYKPTNGEYEYITLDSLKVTDAWKVDVNSLESAAIQLGDDPFIPDGVKDAPILKVINQRKSMRG